jgi:YaiO family outer membrane protein
MAAREFFLTALLMAAVSVGPAYSQGTAGDPRRVMLDSAQVLESKKEYHSAMLVYLSLLSEKPGDAEIMTLFARDLSWEGNLDSSIVVYREVLRTDPKYFYARLGYATVLSWKGDYAGSLRDLMKLYRDYPENTEVLVLVARVSLWAGNVGDAAEFARHALKVDSTNTGALLLLAQSYERILDFDAARESIDKLLLIDPLNADARNMLASLREDFRNMASANLHVDDFGPDNRYSNTIMSLALTRRLSYQVTVSAGIASRNIFGSRDVAGTIGGALRVSDKFTVDGELLIGPGTSTAQRERGTLGLTYIAMSQLSVSTAFQYLQFSGTGVGIFSPSIDYRFSPDDGITVRAYFGETTDRGSSASLLARLRLQLSQSCFVSLSASHGTEYYRLFSESILSVVATGASLAAKFRLAGGFAVAADFNYTGWKSSPWKRSVGGSAGIIYQW